ncbi:DUF4913 domain-containing protein [Nocardia sp. CA-128927]|uniref:DUF4913 domain-containing protein n=1 Tax=Nocardia sp. CA-128927 TaxID=3239975 RepID=UPI003D9965BE
MSSPSSNPAAAAGGKPTGRPRPPAYRDFVEFTDKWLLPLINVRLAEANRENTYTWCSQWWRHRPVSVRIAHLHNAFEASRRSQAGGAMSSYLLSHVDAHCKIILDAANGPMHRCTRTEHNPLDSLSADPMPLTRVKTKQTSTPTTPADEAVAAKPPPPPRYSHYSEFVQQWLLPVIAVRVTANSREGHNTWCRQWWRHHGVALRFAALHKCFEAACRAEDKTAMSSLFVRHIDPHMRLILDAAQGPLHRCSPQQHTELTGLPNSAIAPNWFGVPGAKTSIEHLGWGPDFRALTNSMATSGAES